MIFSAISNVASVGGDCARRLTEEAPEPGGWRQTAVVYLNIGASEYIAGYECVGASMYREMSVSSLDILLMRRDIAVSELPKYPNTEIYQNTGVHRGIGGNRSVGAPGNRYV